MTAQSRFRIAAAVGALIAPLALVTAAVGPADAAVKKHKHDVSIYKVEKWVKLKGVATSSPESPVFDGALSCNAGDHALDGMWLVQHVDRFEPPYVDPTDPDDDPDFPPIGDPTPPAGGFNDERDVFAWWSYPETGAGNGAKWAFKLENFAQGDAQVKLFVTCVKGQTAHAHGHSHAVRVSEAVARTTDHVPAAGRRVIAWGGTGCDATKAYFAAPGFKITNGAKPRLVASFPWRDGTHEKWKWEFDAPADAQINIYGKCIERRVDPASGHRHAIVMRHLPTYEGHRVSISPAADPKTASYSCDQHNPANHGHKAAIGWFWIEDAHEHWFLGMEPQPKTRVFSFWNTSGGHREVALGAFCVNSRTGNPINP